MTRADGRRRAPNRPEHANRKPCAKPLAPLCILVLFHWASCVVPKAFCLPPAYHGQLVMRLGVLQVAVPRLAAAQVPVRGRHAAVAIPLVLALAAAAAGVAPAGSPQRPPLPARVWCQQRGCCAGWGRVGVVTEVAQLEAAVVTWLPLQTAQL